MGSLNMAEISVDGQSGFMTIRSRHKLDVNRSKIIGAVAILLVEPTDATDRSCSVSTGVNSAPALGRGTHKDDVINIADPHSGETDRATLVVPSSVSLISSPCGWMGREGFAKAASRSASHPEHAQSNNARDDTTSPNNKTTESTHDRNMGQDLMQYMYSSTDNPRQRLYNQNKTKDTEYKSPSEESLPTRNVSVIDLTDVPVRQQHTKQNTSATTASGGTYKKHSSSNAFQRPTREPRTSSHAKFTQLIHAPRVSSPFLSRMNFQLQRRKHRNTKISKLVQQPTSQRANDAKCCACGDVLTSFTDNQTHSVKHNLHNQCVVCGIKLPVTSNLRRHFLGHIHNIAFTCPFCPAMYRRKDNLTSHLFQKHNINSMQRRSQQLLSRIGKVPKQIQGIDVTHQSATSLHDLSDRQAAIEVPSNSSSHSGNATVIPALSTITNDSQENTMLLPMETNDSSDLPEEVPKLPDPDTDLEGGQSCSPPIQIKEEPEGNHSSQDVRQPPQTILENQQDEKDQIDHMALYSTGETHDSADISTPDGVCDINSGSILNYSCSTCDVKFSELEKLRQHVDAFHSDEVSTAGAGDEMNTSAPNGYTLTSTSGSLSHDSSEGQDLYLYSNTRRSDMDDETIRMALSSRSNQLEEVIDIENLSDIPNFQHTESAPLQQAGYSGNSRGNILSKTTDFLGNVYPSFFPPTYESSPSNSMNQSYDIDHTNAGFTGRNRISKGNNKCSVCGASLTTWEAILEHGDQHANVLPSDHGSGKKFPCVVCQTVLSTKDSLRRHAVNHMGVQHFCTMCSAVYSRRDNLLKHMRDTHGVHTPRS
ncbi:uncharacterized protein LOC117335074 [Pecten maximus]|uniref:uncharacterized protein LOC117335074 n=1 Tax=Pecten maximus TaxID=6579 RepID=UPI001457FAE0|nr:uncharacterized protein LOC117335074 [Pecten maximus]